MNTEQAWIELCEAVAASGDVASIAAMRTFADFVGEVAVDEGSDGQWMVDSIAVGVVAERLDQAIFRQRPRSPLPPLPPGLDPITLAPLPGPVIPGTDTDYGAAEYVA